MTLFLFGTLRWQTLLDAIAGEPVRTRPARLTGWHVERAAAGDWPVLVAGGEADGIVADDLSDDARARLDWYEVAFGYGVETVAVETANGTEQAALYREFEGGAGGAGEPWILNDWIALHGQRTLVAAPEILRAQGQKTPAEVQAMRKIIHARAQAVVDGSQFRRPITVGSTLSLDDVNIDDVEYPYDGFHRVEEWHLTHRRFAGTQSGPIKRAISHIADAVTVLPFDPVRNRVLVVEQIRIGAVAKRDPLPWLLEPVAGLIDAGETPETTALREAEEEAGLHIKAADLRFMSRYYPSPGGVAQVLWSYAAICDLPDDAAGLGGLENEGEDIRAHLIGLDHLMSMIATAEVANAPLVISAQWLALNRDKLALNA